MTKPLKFIEFTSRNVLDAVQELKELIRDIKHFTRRRFYQDMADKDIKVVEEELDEFDEIVKSDIDHFDFDLNIATHLENFTRIEQKLYNSECYSVFCKLKVHKSMKNSRATLKNLPVTNLKFRESCSIKLRPSIETYSRECNNIVENMKKQFDAQTTALKVSYIR